VTGAMTVQFSLTELMIGYHLGVTAFQKCEIDRAESDCFVNA